MDFNKTVICIDRYGNPNEFIYSEQIGEEDTFTKIIYRIIPAIVSTNDWFEFSVVKLDDKTGKLYSMKNRGIPALSGKGIPEKMIELAAQQLNVTIISSSNNSSAKSLETEWRTPAADKVWQRLVAQNKAIYKSTSDIYTYCS